ncbi:MAG: TolC family protein [Magnetococcales bacterium]|nr:TolC family protein [Magnetococcales bacterium]
MNQWLTKKIEHYVQTDTHKESLSMGMRFCALLIAAVFIGSCTVAPVSQTIEKRHQQAQEDLQSLFKPAKESFDATKPITLSQAMARAIHFHLDSKVKLMESDVALEVSDLAKYNLLPKLSYSGSRTYSDRATTSTSDRDETATNLSVVWNFLDFGVSYLRARQESDRYLLAKERRKRAVHKLLQEVRTTYWQAVTAQELFGAMEPLVERMNRAFIKAKEAERKRLQSPVELLDFQKTLLKTLAGLQRLKRDISSASVRLKELMNIPPGTAITVAIPKDKNLLDLNRLPTLADMERYALLHRPELWEKDYQKRISVDETKKALLRKLPGIELTGGRQSNSGSYYLNQRWLESGIQISWNLFNLVTAPRAIELGHSKEKLEDMRRMAMSMAVLGQVHIAYRNLLEAREKYNTAKALSDVNDLLFEHASAGQKAKVVDEMELIRRYSDQITYKARWDKALAELQKATGVLAYSLGVDVLTEDDLKLDIINLEKKFQNSEQKGGGITINGNICPFGAVIANETLHEPATNGDIGYESAINILIYKSLDNFGTKTAPSVLCVSEENHEIQMANWDIENHSIGALKGQSSPIASLSFEMVPTTKKAANETIADSDDIELLESGWTVDDQRPKTGNDPYDMELPASSWTVDDQQPQSENDPYDMALPASSWTVDDKRVETDKGEQ